VLLLMAGECRLSRHNVEGRPATMDKKPTTSTPYYIPYENEHMELPPFSQAEVSTVIPPDSEPLTTPQILHAVTHPIGTKPLSTQARGKSKVLIILENATRPLDTSFVASLVLEELRQAGVADKHISFLFANGAHKGMEEHNYQQKLGSRFKHFRILNHDCEGELTRLGTTKLGSPILINSLVLEADLKIAIGTIEPHYGNGFSGGAKILFPGCAGLAWIVHNHSLNRGEFGVVDNQWRNDTEESAEKVGINFLVNAVLNYKRKIVGLYCGHWIQAHRKGARLAMKAAVAELPSKVDFCLAGSSPFDMNFIQSLKGIDAVQSVIKENGTYVMFASCREGLGEHRWLLGKEMLAKRQEQNAEYDSAKTEIIYSTHLSEHELHSFYPKQVKLIKNKDQLKRVLMSLDKPDRKGVVLPYSPITILRRPAEYTENIKR